MTGDAVPLVVIPLGPEEDLERALAAADRHRLRDVGGAGTEGPPTTVAFAASLSALLALFEVVSEPPLTVLVPDGGPVHEDECVELFVADPLDPTTYREIVVNPAGARYGALVANPDDSRATWSLLPGSLPEGLRIRVSGEPGGAPVRDWRRWTCRLRVPWTSLSASAVPPRPGQVRRLNAFRIARGAVPRHLALSPTFRAAPPDFHVPSRFARALLAPAAAPPAA